MRPAGLCSVSIAIVFLAVIPCGAHAQMFQCPAGSSQNWTSGYSYDCRCPDGSLAGISGCAQSAGPPAPPPSICPSGYSYCGTSNMCCGAGSYCSKYGCTPIGAVDCGTGFCNPGQACRSDGRCMPAGDTECGDHSCSAGYHCGSRNSCIANGAADCGNGTSCSGGNKCSRDGKHCISQDTVDCGNHFCSAGFRCGSGNQCLASGVDCGNGSHCDDGRCSFNGKMCLARDQVDCGGHVCGAGSQCGANNECIPKDVVDCGHGHYCAAGMACGSEYQCMARGAIDCGGGLSCPSGKTCVKGGLECLTPTELAEQRSIEQRLGQEATVQAKEDNDSEAWLMKQQERLANEADQRNKKRQTVELKLENHARELESKWNSERAAQPQKQQPAACDTIVTILGNVSAGQADSHPTCVSPASTGQGTTVTTIIAGNRETTGNGSPASVDTTVAGPLIEGTGTPGRTAKGASSAQPGVSNPGTDGPAGPSGPSASNSQASGTAAATTLQLNPDLKTAVTLTGPPASTSTSGLSSPGPNYNPQASFSASPSTASGQNAGIWSRIQNAASIANSTCTTDATCQQGKRQVEATAAAGGVGCAIGGLLGGGAGAAAGGAPAIPGAIAGCAAGAAAGETVLNGVETAYQVEQTVSKIVGGQQSTGKISTSATDVLADVADQATDKIPVSSVVQYGGSWGTFFAYAFYTNPPGN
jgi:hypothetical protein